MFRRTATSVVLGALLALPALADPAQGPLSPGKPAGIHDAQLGTNGLIFVAVAAGVIVVGLYLASGTYTIPAQPAPTSTQ
jgi:hypothetical protein